MYGYETYDVIVIGSGPAGLTAAGYCARGGLKTAIIEALPESGGQMVLADTIDNYPGLDEMKGFEIGKRMKAWAKGCGAIFYRGRATRIEDNLEGGRMKRVLTGAKDYKGKTIIYAAGAVHGRLGLNREEEMRGRGVSYCATCDGTFYRGKRVAVIGGGDTALRDALYLSGICERVTLIHRRKEFRGQEIYLRRCEEAENIEIVRGAVCEEIYGEKKVTGIGLVKDSGAGVYVQCDGVFIAVGMIPETELMQGFCDMDKEGYIIAGEDCVTSAPGIFAAGDVRTKEFRQIVTAVADGANAARSAALYILDMEKPEEKDEKE